MALNSRKFFPVATGEDFRDLTPPLRAHLALQSRLLSKNSRLSIRLPPSHCKRPQASRKSSITASTRLSSRTSRATNKLFATSRFRPRSPISQRMKRPAATEFPHEIRVRREGASHF